MNREALIARVSDVTHVPKRDIERIVLAFLDAIKSGLQREREVTLVGFGQFTVSRRAARRGVHPRHPTQELRVPAVNIVRFRAGTSLKKTVREP